MVDGQVLRALRLAKFMTQQELAQQSGVSAWTISHLETGVGSCQVSTVRKLAKALGVQPVTLVEQEVTA